jgi:hypothetical protein
VSFSKLVMLKPGEDSAKVLHTPAVGNDDCPAERDLADKTASSRAIDILDSGVLGSTEEYGFSVSISGHVNPENKPRSGWANSCVNISIVQQSGVAPE